MRPRAASKARSRLRPRTGIPSGPARLTSTPRPPPLGRLNRPQPNAPSTQPEPVPGRHPLRPDPMSTASRIRSLARTSRRKANMRTTWSFANSPMSEASSRGRSTSGSVIRQNTISAAAPSVGLGIHVCRRSLRRGRSQLTTVERIRTVQTRVTPGTRGVRRLAFPWRMEAHLNSPSHLSGRDVERPISVNPGSPAGTSGARFSGNKSKLGTVHTCSIEASC